MRLPGLLDPGPRLRIFSAITIASAAVISFDSIRHLADYAGFGDLSWLFPLTLDAVAAFGMDLWIRRSPAWKQARALALVSILGSTVANVADHYISSRGTILPAVLGAVPPAALAALLAVLHRHGAGTAAAGPVLVNRTVRDEVWRSLPQADRYRIGGPVIPDRIVVPMTSTPAWQAVRSGKVREDRPPAVRSSGPADDVVVEKLRAMHAETGRWPTKAVVMAEFKPMGTNRALKLIKLAKETGTDE